jgi:hypothetical protein
MRGYDRPQTTMLTLVNPERRVPANHPIRLIKELAEVALKELSPLFEQMYSEVGRPSIPPERLPWRRAFPCFRRPPPVGAGLLAPLSLSNARGALHRMGRFAWSDPDHPGHLSRFGSNHWSSRAFQYRILRRGSQHARARCVGSLDDINGWVSALTSHLLLTHYLKSYQRAFLEVWRFCHFPSALRWLSAGSRSGKCLFQMVLQ